MTDKSQSDKKNSGGPGGLFSFFVPIIGTVQSSNIQNRNVRASVRATRGREGPQVVRSAVAAVGTEVRRAPEKKCGPATDRRARTKRRGKNISAGAKARERKKNIWGGSEKKSGVNEDTTHKKKSFRRERKIILASTRTQPTKRLTYSRDVFFFYLFLSGVSTGRSCNHQDFF